MTPEELRKDFPILARTVNGQPLVYLDNAATTQKPRVVIDALTHFYETSNANIHRGIHTLSVEATDQYEAVRGEGRQRTSARRPRARSSSHGTRLSRSTSSHAPGATPTSARVTKLSSR